MASARSNPRRFVEAITRSHLTIYDAIEIGDPQLWIPSPELEVLLNENLVGLSLAGLPLRTRSKLVKEYVCRALGYTPPASFRKTRPRFPGQCFDTYVQKSNNLQVWNEELAPARRYVLIRVSGDFRITKVKVVTGATLARLDTTCALTQKYQARCNLGSKNTELIVRDDTDRLKQFVKSDVDLKVVATPINYPQARQLLPIAAIFDRLKKLVGVSFQDAGTDQERNRGAVLHRLVCEALGYKTYQDDGRFPDVRHQLLEVKLQTASTIDLGLVRPDSNEPLDVPKIHAQQIRHSDVRYAIFYGQITGREVTLTHFFLTTGKAFFGRFPQFQGRILNRKLQIPLPADFFSR